MTRMLGFALLLMLGVGLVSDAEALIEHRQSWNTNGEEAVLAGYDVVAYHRLGKATMGSPEFMAEWMGGVFLFTNKAHLKAFLKDSRKYAPQFGGYCSCTVAHGYTAPVDAKDAWEVYRGKLYLNFSANIHKQWIEQQDYNIQYGVENWPQLAGERGWVISSKVQQLAKPLVETEIVDRVRRWFESKIFKD